MALHKPIVTTDMNECHKYDSIFIADDHNDFIEKLDKALSLKDDHDYIALLDKEARENDWSMKAKAIIDLISENESPVDILSSTTTMEVGIDIGSSKTVIFSSSKVVLELPSIVTVDSESYEPFYYGEKARQTLGRTPDSFECVFPIKHGVIAEYDIAEAMLKEYMSKAFGNKIIRPKIMATLPVGLTELQHHSLSNVVEAAVESGLKTLYTSKPIDKPINLANITAIGRYVIHRNTSQIVVERIISNDWFRKKLFLRWCLISIIKRLLGANYNMIKKCLIR